MEWAIIFATLVGPVLAVQAQKWVERSRERRNRKEWVFRQLMGTRGARTSKDHVHALNLIDIFFHGHGVRRSRREQAVLDAWKEYLDQLNTQYPEKDLSIWSAKCDELFVNLLHAISIDLGFSFDRVQLKRGAYAPIAHGNLEAELAAIRGLTVEVLSGNRPVKMNITSLPPLPPNPPQAQIPDAQTTKRPSEIS